MKKNSDAQLKATRNYEKKTYKRYSVYLRLEDDKEIIKSIDTARENGLNIREWIVNLYNNKK